MDLLIRVYSFLFFCCISNQQQERPTPTGPCTNLELQDQEIGRFGVVKATSCDGLSSSKIAKGSVGKHADGGGLRDYDGSLDASLSLRPEAKVLSGLRDLGLKGGLFGFVPLGAKSHELLKRADGKDAQC